MLTCRELAHRHASDYLDGQLGWRGRLGVRFHLLICDHCRRFIAQLEKVRALLRDRPLPPPRKDSALDSVAQELGARLASAYAQQKPSAAEKKSPPL